MEQISIIAVSISLIRALQTSVSLCGNFRLCKAGETSKTFLALEINLNCKSAQLYFLKLSFFLYEAEILNKQATFPCSRPNWFCVVASLKQEENNFQQKRF